MAVLEATGFILRNLLDTLRENDIEINKLFCSGGLQEQKKMAWIA